MNEHFALIHLNCDIVAEVTEPWYGVYYIEDGQGYAEFDTPYGIADYSCNSEQEFKDLYGMVLADDDFEWEPELEIGFDPYEGCYTFDC